MKSVLIRMAMTLVVVAGLVPLAACTTTLAGLLDDVKTVATTDITNPLSDNAVTQLGNALGVANATVVAYGHLPLCPAGHTIAWNDWCHDKIVLVTLDHAMHAAYTAFDELTTYQAAHPQGSTAIGGGFAAIYNQARDAIITIKQIVDAYHIPVVQSTGG